MLCSNRGLTDLPSSHRPQCRRLLAMGQRLLYSSDVVRGAARLGNG